MHSRVPCNDGGISIGQAVAAARDRPVRPKNLYPERRRVPASRAVIPSPACRRRRSATDPHPGLGRRPRMPSVCTLFAKPCAHAGPHQSNPCDTLGLLLVVSGIEQNGTAPHVGCNSTSDQRDQQTRPAARRIATKVNAHMATGSTYMEEATLTTGCTSTARPPTSCRRTGDSVTCAPRYSGAGLRPNLVGGTTLAQAPIK